MSGQQQSGFQRGTITSTIPLAVAPIGDPGAAMLVSMLVGATPGLHQPVLWGLVGSEVVVIVHAEL